MEIQNNNTAKSKSVLKRIFLFIIGILVLLMLGVSVLVGALFYYEDDIKAAVIKELNKNLSAEVKVDPENIHLTIIKTFPDCSIEFSDVLMLEALNVKKRDTLMFASKLNLCFNVRDIWHKKYNIEKVKLKEGLINLVVLKDGKVNYAFWKSSETEVVKGNKDSLNFKLNSILIEGFRFRYVDKGLKFRAELDLNHLAFSGNFSEASYELQMKGETFIKQISSSKTNYLKSKNCDFELAFDVKENLYEISEAKIRINRMGLELKGNMTYSDSLENMKFEFSAPHLDISSLLSLLPEKFREQTKDYESDGVFFVKGKYSYSGKGKYNLNSDFGVNNAIITYRPNDIKVDRLNLEGHLKLSQSSSILELKQVKLNMYEDEIKGSCTIIDFSHPFIKLEASAKMRLDHLIQFFPMDTIAKLSGRLNLSTNIEGELVELKKNTFGNKVIMKLEANADSLVVKFKGDEKALSLHRGSLNIEEGEVKVKDCKLLRGSSDVLVNGKIPGLFNYLTDRSKPLIISGDLHSENLKLEDFMMKYNSSESKNAPIIPANIYFKLDASIGKFSYANFNAEQINGDIEIKNQKAIITDMKFVTMEGSAEVDAYFDNSKNRLEVVLQSELKHINISELFSQFNNFGQNTLIDNNIKGFATASIDFSGKWSNSLDVDYNSITSNGEVSITKGELIDFKPMMSLSKYVDVKDLEHILFSALQSTVSISNQIINIQKTSIKNSAMNIDFWGSHSFNNEINYHIQLLISELLARQRKYKDSEFGKLENDLENRRTAFILMTGTVDNPIFKYDKSAMKDKIKSDIKEEKNNIKQLLKDEFGLFKKDTVQKRKKEKDTEFELEKPNKTPAKKPLEPKKKEEEDEGDF